MKILMVTGGMDVGGAETHVFELVRSLARMGNEITLISSGGRLADALGREGVPQVALKLNSRDLISIIKSRRALKKLLRKREFDIVHAHTRLGAFIASGLCSDAEIPLVTTIHARYKKNTIFDRLSQWGNGVIAVSDDLAFYLRTLRPKAFLENISVIPNGIDTQRFSPSGTLYNSDSKRIVFASRLDKDCSHSAYLLLDIAREVDEKYPKVEMVICGGGEELCNIRERAKEVNASIGRDVVRVLGYVDDMQRVLGGAFVFLGVSRAALEAMACGAPVILSGNEGYIGVVSSENLSLCESTNFCCRGQQAATASKLYSSLVSVLEMTDKEYKKTSDNLREYTVRHHSCEYMVAKTLEFYKKYIKVSNNGKKQVLLCGYYGFGNVGDDAQLLRSIQRVNIKYPHSFICAMTKNGRRDERKFGVNCIGRVNALSVKNQIEKSDIVVLGGGTLLQNDTSRRSLLYYLWVINYALRVGKRVELWGNGLGDIKGKHFRRKTALALSKCFYIGMRDRVSLVEANCLLNENGVKCVNLTLEDDLAAQPFALKASRVENLRRFFEISENERIVIVALKRGEERKLARGIVRFLRLLKSDGIRSVFVVMYPAEDMRVTKRLCRDVGGVLAYPMSISDMAELIRSARLVLSMRYHTLVFAHAAGVPFVGIGKSEKIERFCKDKGGKYCGRKLDI